jgi:hypothetical protein
VHYCDFNLKFEVQASQLPLWQAGTRHQWHFLIQLELEEGTAAAISADRIADQVPPVEPPVGAVLGVLGVGMRREHAEPAGTAVPAP